MKISITRKLTLASVAIIALMIVVVAGAYVCVLDTTIERTKTFIVISFIALVCALGIGVFFVVGIARPIRSLFAASLAFSKGDLNAKADIKSHDEFGAMAETFNRMAGDRNRFTLREKALTKAAIITADIHREKAEQLKKAYEELKETQAMLVQTEKLAVMGQLASGVAHEINNPLTAISIEAEMLFRDSDKDQDTQRASKVILEQSRRIQVIIERLSAFSRKREFKQKPVDINSTLEESFSLVAYEPKMRNVKIIKELSDDLPELLGDSNQLQEVFLNIMLNAAQAMEKGGILTIRTRAAKVASEHDKGFETGQELIAVEFHDTGSGMDEVTKKRIFDPFFTTKEKGTGLGLAICHRIVESHHGIIAVESEVGKGSAFIVKLPVKKWGKA